MTDLHDIFEAKKIENEFQNREVHKDQITAPYQPLVDEMMSLVKRINSFQFQAEQLERRLYFLQKNYYDTMKIIDEDYMAYDGEVFPWRSKEKFTRNKYKFWDVDTKHLNLDLKVQEVAIRREGHEKEIKVLDNICKRIMALDDMYFKAVTRRREIKEKLNAEYGGIFIANSPD